MTRENEEDVQLDETCGLEIGCFSKSKKRYLVSTSHYVCFLYCFSHITLLPVEVLFLDRNHHKSMKIFARLILLGHHANLDLDQKLFKLISIKFL